MYLFYLAAHSPERHTVLVLLSPKPRRLWEDILNDKLIVGGQEIEHYSGTTGAQGPKENNHSSPESADDKSG